MLVDVIVQFQRFTITENFGCEASIYVSIPAIIIIWPLPLLLCSITFLFAGLSLYNYHRRRTFSSQHRQPRSEVNTELFFRFLVTSVFIAVYVIVVAIYDMISRVESGLSPWISWIQVHSSLSSSIGIVSEHSGSPSDRSAFVRTEIGWWLIPISSIVSVVIIGSASEVILLNRTLLVALWNKLLRTSDDKDILPIQYVDPRLLFSRPITFAIQISLPDAFLPKV